MGGKAKWYSSWDAAPTAGRVPTERRRFRQREDRKQSRISRIGHGKIKPCGKTRQGQKQGKREGPRQIRPSRMEQGKKAIIIGAIMGKRLQGNQNNKRAGRVRVRWQ